MDEVAEGYRRLAEVAADKLTRLTEGGLGDTELLTIAVELAAALTAAADPDPLLPPELLPLPWPGAAARELVARCWALLLADPRPGEPLLFAAYADVVAAVAG
ncbi:PaaX family transcriptional regulator C-terminal domain-containing protein [Kitasatospora sp. NPDC094028]